MRKQKQGRKSAKRRLSSAKKAFLGFGTAAVVLAAVLIVPSPYPATHGSVRLVETEASENVYGPQLPETIVGGYTMPVIESVVLPETSSSESEVQYVYASEDQKNYHMPTCRFAYASSKKLTLYEAYFLGYEPGKCCNAPAYSPNK